MNSYSDVGIFRKYRKSESRGAMGKALSKSGRTLGGGVI